MTKEEIECESCFATGLHYNPWFKELQKCNRCNGTGKITINFILFTKKKTIDELPEYKKYILENGGIHD